MIFKKQYLLALMATILFSGLFAQKEPIEIVVQKPKKEISVKSNMYGVFFEDINFGADGGLYAEKVKNRSFDFTNSPLMGWTTYGNVEVLNEGAPFERNPNFLHLENTGLLTGTGILNEGFRGIGLEKDQEYKLSFYARKIGNLDGKLRCEIISSGNDIIARAEKTVDSKDWTKYELVLKSRATEFKGKLRIDLTEGDIHLEHVSLFPKETFKGRENGMRVDLATALAELKPGIFRFPGGCIIEGNSLETRYQWKNSVGPVENRPVNENRWNYEFQHKFTPDYFQSYGLGFFEYFQLCEDLNADALPVVNCGMACQYATDEVEEVENLDPYIQDAIDLIEFANGPVNSKWGKVRSDMGHPAPFNLKFVGIGNEQWGKEFPIHLELFTKAIHEKYPDILVIGSSGPQASGEEFDYLWKENARIKVDLVDEHYYRPPNWFLENADRYDSYNRDWPAVFAGEYACHVRDRKNSFYSALCEAAFLTGIERNADIVHLATYAPLFAHVDAWQWKPDMIWFDNLRSVKSANYYVQQMYSHYSGTSVFVPKLNNENIIGQQGLYATVATDEAKKQLIVKVANVGKEAQKISLDLKDLKLKLTGVGKQILLKGDMNIENTLEQPQLIVPVEEKITIDPKNLTLNLDAESFNVFVFDLEN